MIITESKPIDVLKTMLDKQKRTGIVACNSHAAICNTGGRKRLVEMAERLKKDGYNVVQTDLISMPCSIDFVVDGIDVDEFLILGCDAAVKSFQMLFPSKKVVPGLETIGLGARDAQGRIIVLKDFRKSFLTNF